MAQQPTATLLLDNVVCVWEGMILIIHCNKEDENPCFGDCFLSHMEVSVFTIKNLFEDTWSADQIRAKLCVGGQIAQRVKLR